MGIRTPQYPKLELSEEFVKKLDHKEVPEKVRLKVLEALLALNTHGTNKEYLKPDVEKTHRKKILEMKFKGPAKTEWRILFQKITTDQRDANYGIMTFFLKKTQKLRKQDLDAAERIAEREGW